MSMWDYVEQGDPYPPDERHQYRDTYALHGGSESSDYHGGYGGCQSYSDHSHHQYGHDQHQHQHRMEPDASLSHSYHGHGFGIASLSRHNYGSRHDLYGDSGGHQSYVQNDVWQEPNGYRHNTAHRESYASNMSPASYHPGYDMSVGYEVRQEHHAADHDASNRPDLFTSDCVVNLTLDEIDALARTHRSRSWLVVLYAPWCRFCQAMEPNFERVANHLERSSVYVGKFQADGDYKEYAKRYLQLEYFPTILFLPKDSSHIVKYHSENREVDALLGFVHAFE